MPSVAELIAALPEPVDAAETDLPAPLNPLLEAWSHRPVPVGRFRRLRMLGTLQAQIAAAYAFYWLRGWFKGADESKRLLAETHWRTAMRILDSMSYLRGAAMKVGQTLANFPDIVPREFVETLEKLHFTAPPMHWSLLKEMVFNELNEEPENLFAAFDKRAFAAASLGQVHAARLKTGEEVAVKIQYPGIARTIREDIRNLSLCMLPGRLSRDWESTKEQLEDLRVRLERETDYEQEAASLERARTLFHEDDGIVVPRVYRAVFDSARSDDGAAARHASRRVSRDQSIAGTSQRIRQKDSEILVPHAVCRPNAVRRSPSGQFLIHGGWSIGCYRLWIHAGTRRYAVGIFAQSRPADDNRSSATNASRPSKNGLGYGDDPSDDDRVRLGEEFADWIWRARYCGGEFDFGDEADFRRRRRLVSATCPQTLHPQPPCTPSISRHIFGFRSIFYRLKAKFDIAAIAEEEVRATGWDRSDYAPPR